ncbi:zinc finger, CCHC-type, retrotransposon gag domain protein [Tanacetum coccineum]
MSAISDNGKFPMVDEEEVTSNKLAPMAEEMIMLIEAYKQAKGGDVWVLTLTWAAFKELFFLQFFPRAEQERLKREYHSIRQRASENSTEYMQHFLRLAGFLGQAAGTAEEQAKNFRWGLHKSILDHVMCIQFTDVAQVADAARNLEILRDRDDYDRSERSDKRHKSGDRYQSATQQNSYRGHDQKNDRQGSDRQGGGGNYRNNNNNYSRDNNRSNLNRYRLYLLYDMNLTSRHGNRNSGAGRDQRNRGSQQSRVPSEGYTHPVCNTCGRRHPGECRRAAGTCFKCGQAGHLQRDCKKNIGASSSGHADKKPDASGRVFALTQDQAANTSGDPDFLHDASKKGLVVYSCSMENIIRVKRNVDADAMSKEDGKIAGIQGGRRDYRDLELLDIDYFFVDRMNFCASPVVVA